MAEENKIKVKIKVKTETRQEEQPIKIEDTPQIPQENNEYIDISEKVELPVITKLFR